jgi:hypothetical protein
MQDWHHIQNGLCLDCNELTLQTLADTSDHQRRAGAVPNRRQLLMVGHNRAGYTAVMFAECFVFRPKSLAGSVLHRIAQ